MMKRLATALFIAAAHAPAATFTVTNTDDSGAGSLRQAIEDANSTPGADTIAFNIPGAGVHTITPTTALPAASQTVTIDGYTQPGASPNTDPIATNAVILIELDGSLAGPVTGIQFVSHDGSILRGVSIHHFITGVNINGGSTGCSVFGCFVGTNAAGTVAPGNTVGISSSTPGNIIGGAAPADRNLISGNVFGVYVLGNGAVIRGNLMGTDATGNAALANTDTAIVCANFGGAGTMIGGSSAGEGNVISGNARGIWVSQGNVVDVIRGNRIGTTADGAGRLGNGDGIFTNVGGEGTIIGGVGPGEANEIAYNSSEGILFTTNGGSNNSARGNSIHDNGGLGIDIGNHDGPNFNDPLDADNGPNHMQNFPVVRQVEHLGPQGTGSTRVVGKLHSTPSTTFDLDFYANPACSNFPREFIEGQIYLGSSEITTDTGGDAAFDETFPIVTEPGARIAVTATDPAGNTSEFSQRIIFSIGPTSGPSDGGTSIGVSGTDFADPTTMTIGGVAVGVTFLNDHVVNTFSPAFPPGTSHDVVVETPDGTTGTLIKGWVSDFLDVPAAHIFHDFVVTLVSNGITVGVGGGNYGVDQGTKRQQMAVFLLKSKYGLCYVPPTCTGTFPDVPCPSLFADWIEALAAEGITTGCGGGLFCPNNLVTRRQMAVFLLKSKYGSSYVPPACTGVFDDVPCPGAPAVDFIERLAAEQITGGCSVSPPLYCPDNSSTRGQMAVFIVKTFNLQ